MLTPTSDAIILPLSSPFYMSFPARKTRGEKGTLVSNCLDYQMIHNISVLQCEELLNGLKPSQKMVEIVGGYIDYVLSLNSHLPQAPYFKVTLM